MKQQTRQGPTWRRQVLVKVGILVGVMVGWLWSGTSLALVIAIMQITHAGGCSQHPSINKDGDRVAFLSNRNLTGSNADGNDEVFVWQRATGGFTQVTNSTGCCNGDPVISAKNNRVAFRSNLDLVVGNNPDGSEELFLWDSKAGLKQLTNDSSGHCCLSDPTITGDGKRIAFESNLDLVGSNADGNVEIFLWDDKAGLTQVTNTTSGGNFSPAISADDIRIAFVSDADLVGSNADGNQEIFLWDAQAGLTQLTNTTSGGNFSPTISAEGKRIAFVSDADLVGSNVDGNQEIFLWDAQAGLTQLTNTTHGDSFGPTISAEGKRIAFASEADLVGSNADGNQEIFLWDSNTGISQITNTAQSAGINNFEPTIDKKGDTIAFTVEQVNSAFSSGSDEIFVADVARK